MNKRVLTLVLASLVSAAALAQPPSRVEDINVTQTGGTWQPWPSGTHFVEMGGAFYFLSSDGIHGTELWRTDGTAAGTRIVKDICPGSCASWILRLAVWGSTLYFAADDGAHGKELWKSDGTEAGTQQVADIVPGFNGSVPSEITPLGGSVLFEADSSSGYGELWISDGSAAGTSLVKDLDPGSSSGGWPWGLTPFGGQVFFSAADLLWKTDGTKAGTVQIADIAPGLASPSPDSLTPSCGGYLFFSADDGSSGRELWVTTPFGTHLAKDIRPGSGSGIVQSWGAARWAVADGCRLLFPADDGSAGEELWVYDGSEMGPRRLRDIFPGPRSSEIRDLTAATSPRVPSPPPRSASPSPAPCSTSRPRTRIPASSSTPSPASPWTEGRASTP